MRAGEPRGAAPDLTRAPTDPSASPLQGQPGRDRQASRPAQRRWWVAAAWTVGILALFAFFLRIALSLEVDSDGANNALQAWDILHGNPLLHNWIIGDATYYTFDLPIFTITEAFFGLHAISLHVAGAVIYLIIAVSAMALARTNSSGAAAAVRCGIVVAVLAAPFTNHSSTWIMLAKPDHVGTTALLLLYFLLIDRGLGRRFTPPLLFVILCAGQIDDALVLYVAVPAIVVVSIYRTVAARTIRSGDTAIAVAALISVPVSMLIRSAMIHLGGYVMIAPRVKLQSFGQLAHNGYLTLRSIVIMFGTQLPAGSPLGLVGTAFGIACLTAAGFGFGKVVWNWRTAGPAEQMMCVAIVVNVCAYLFSTLPVDTNPREIAALVPCGAVLAARALVPARISAVRRSRLALVAAAAAALLPLTAAATHPAQKPAASSIAAWLEAHGLSYGIAGYWDAADVTVVSGNRVRVRSVQAWGTHLAVADWETKTDWYNASVHDATFVIAGIGPYTHSLIPASVFEQYLGRPAAIYTVAGRQILLYRFNVLSRVTPGPAQAGP
jgi:hypothetical protein